MYIININYIKNLIKNQYNLLFLKKYYRINSELIKNYKKYVTFNRYRWFAKCW